MSPQSRITPIALVAASAAAAAYGFATDDAITFGLSCLFFAISFLELRQTVLFNRDVHRVNRKVRQAE